ncbi:tetratricopeptide repeat protein, partial [Patescibacteria group bacterium]|nr:tetratricopeptide repeat protein [Patescibacteria group bacterium]
LHTKPLHHLPLKKEKYHSLQVHYNINLLKSKARVEIYLSNIDPKYQQQALNTLLQASLLAPTDAKLLFNIGILYQNLQKPALATNSFKKAVEIKPNYAEALYNLNKL